MIKTDSPCDVVLQVHGRGPVAGRGIGQTADRTTAHGSVSPAGTGVDDGTFDDGGDSALLRRVLSDVRRAYCRQPLSGMTVDDANVAGSQAQSTEFTKQLSDYSDHDLDHKTTTSASSLFRSKSDSRPSRPHVVVRPSSKDDHQSAAVATRRTRAASATGQSPAAGGKMAPASNKAVVVGGSIRFGGGRTSHEIRVSLRPRRALSLDRPISMPPFLRPIEEEESATCSARTPTETIFVGAMTSPPSSPGSSSSPSTTDDDDDEEEEEEEEEDLPTANGNDSHGRHHRRRHYNVDAKLYGGQNRWMNLNSSTASQSGTTTTTTTDNRMSRPTTISCEPDFGATCFDSDEECLCTSTVRSASAAARRLRFEQHVAAPSVRQASDECRRTDLLQSDQGRDGRSTCPPTSTASPGDRNLATAAPPPPDSIAAVSAAAAAAKVTSSIDITTYRATEVQRPETARDVTSSSRVTSPSSSSSSTSTRLHFYVLMTSVAVFVACLTSASPLCLVALVALLTFVTYPIAKL